MKIKFLALAIALTVFSSLKAENYERYIEVTGTSEIEIVPDKIHYLIEIREYFIEEFDGKSKPEEYRTKCPLSEIEQGLRTSLERAGIPQKSIRTQEIGDYWRQQGQDYLLSKKFDITLTDFNQINKIIEQIDTRGIQSMRIGDLENKDIAKYRRMGKIEALKAAQHKATYMLDTIGKKPGNVIRIEEINGDAAYPFTAQSNIISSEADNFDSFRIIVQRYSVTVRFEILD